MILLTVDPKVLSALTAAFPKPAKSAIRALHKYVKTLQALIFAALQRGQNNHQRLFNLYSISTHALQNSGGCIGNQRVRMHKWLEDNGLPLVKVVTKGSNITGKVSEVKLTPLVTVQNLLATQNLPFQNSNTAAAQVNDDMQNSRLLFQQLYPEITTQSSEADVLELFDTVEIDQASLAHYLQWVSTKATRLSRHTKNTYINQTTQILRIASFTGGLYLQRKKPSFFGRNYYSAISVQSFNKQLRRAMLGDCYEYDISSSATAWKMGFAREIVSLAYKGQSVRQVFSATLLYLEDKKSCIQELLANVFSKRNKANEELQKSLLKLALNAIGFGARLGTQGWKDASGSWTNPALVDILMNPTERDRFVNDYFVKKFIDEQTVIDSYLYDYVKINSPQLLANSNLQIASGRPSKSKIIAYLYQHGETQVMDVVRQSAANQGKIPLANVHDAIFFRKRLSGQLKFDIEQAMQYQTGNPYWKLACKGIDGYKAQLPEPDIDERSSEQIFLDLLEMNSRLLASL